MKPAFYTGLRESELITAPRLTELINTLTYNLKRGNHAINVLETDRTRIQLTF